MRRSEPGKWGKGTTVRPTRGFTPVQLCEQSMQMIIVISCQSEKTHPAPSLPLIPLFRKGFKNIWLLLARTHRSADLHTHTHTHITTATQMQGKQYQHDKHFAPHHHYTPPSFFIRQKRADLRTSLEVYVIIHMWCAFQIRKKSVHPKTTHWIHIPILPQIRWGGVLEVRRKGCGWNKYRGIIS